MFLWRSLTPAAIASAAAALTRAKPADKPADASPDKPEAGSGDGGVAKN